jgi:hypothetical protein
MNVTPARRGFALLLLLALTLTACGRATPRVTAEDGRGGNGPSGTIWIPETRDVDGGPDPRAAEETEDDADAADRRPRRGGAEEERDRTDASETSREDDREADREAPTPPEAPEPSATPARQATPAAEPRTSESPGREERRTSPRPPSDEDEETAPATADPEPAGDCGVRRDEHQPSRAEIEQAAERLADEVAERWPDTHGGVWVDEGARPLVHVAFSERAQEHLAAVCRSFEHPDRLRGVAVALSAAELDKAAEHVTTERDALRKGEPPADLPEEIRATEGRYTVTVDQPNNRLTVVVERVTSGLEAAFTERYIPRLRLEEGDVERSASPRED